ncbi:hypothetical protein [Anaerovorax odorimutans]|uniref:hypothetical protein n=1 Tax=Anaerovorax odorimutans TaxID=109327 RepID=UPI000406F352|nr:hypothetical protein [Anaerovorax odorimutans]
MHIEKGLKEKDTINKTLELLNIARKNNFMTIHAPLVYKNNYLEINDRREGLVKAVKKNER